MDAPGGAAISRDEDLIADAFLTVAVNAAGLRARRFAEEALLIFGAAIVRARCTASSSVSTTLFIPAITMISRGPNTMAATRFPLPSIFTSSPVRLTAFAPVRKKSAERQSWAACSRSASVCMLAVDGAPRAVPQGLLQADLVSRARAAPANQRALGDQPQRSSKRRGSVRAVACIKMPGAQILQQDLRALFIKQRNRFHRFSLRFFFILSRRR